MTTHPRNYPDDQIEHPDQGSAPDPDHYDDFIASDVLHAFIRSPGNYAEIVTSFFTNPDGELLLGLNGSVELTPEQAAALSPLFAPSSEG